jgi:hypothetical protein
MRAVSDHLSVQLADIHRQLQNSWCKGQSSILPPVKWNSEALPLGINSLGLPVCQGGSVYVVTVLTVGSVYVVTVLTVGSPVVLK